MGLSYFYVNHDKDQFFACGLGSNGRFWAIGQGRGSRALTILLSSHGTWKGDRISVVDDASEEFEELVVRGLNIEVEVELMLIQFDGLGWLEEWLDSPIPEFATFARCCSYAILLRHPRITEMLNRKYGVGKWQQQYEKYLQGNTDLWSDKVIDAKNRGIALLKPQTAEG
ncbi:hypothetical protein [Limnoglobus roseus]|uniref:Uncharacterized protein n=1 Tax=Limnoglobus roseus TaxID=2598579 RepID=A0A5C1ABP2_9BACT|nr:hypothetical protein [Limnoglobus roseus]QEL14448.1 hypothetical protein PX52LOC_01336 [Limnoglobus roseus]